MKVTRRETKIRNRHMLPLGLATIFYLSKTKILPNYGDWTTLGNVFSRASRQCQEWDLHNRTKCVGRLTPKVAVGLTLGWTLVGRGGGVHKGT